MITKGVGRAGDHRRTPEDFAVFGAEPAFSEPRHVGAPNLGDRERFLRRIGGMLDRRWLTNDGPLVTEFEAAVAAVAGVRHCVATCNGTLALQIAIRAAGLAGEVITTPFTFAATAHALQWLGITPVFCDIDPRTHNLDPAQVEKWITPRTTGILGVHLWGRPCDVEALEEIAERHGIALLFDAAHAFGSSHRGRMIGGFGRAEVFSFHATKVINSIEGGAIVTDDDDLAEQARLIRNFGFAGYDEVSALGTNAKMTEASAAMGLTSLESLDRFVSVNERNLEAYRTALRDVAGVRLLGYDDEELAARQYVVVEVDGSAGMSRDDLQRVLWAENVLARRYFFPGCHRSAPYRSAHPVAPPMPQTDRVAARVLTLPTGTAVAEEDVAVIGGLIASACGIGPRFSRMLREQEAGAAKPAGPRAPASRAD